MAKMPISKLTIRGLRSIRELADFELRYLNVLIGANGSGKSNLVLFLRMVSAMESGRLQSFVRQFGSARSLLFRSARRAESIAGRIEFGSTGYDFELLSAEDGSFYYGRESVWIWDRSKYSKPHDEPLGSGQLETRIREHSTQRGIHGGKSLSADTRESIQSWIVYHFHDTGHGSSLREPSPERADHARLEKNGRNLAALLLRLKQENCAEYSAIVDAVRAVAPFFDDFVPVAERTASGEQVTLLWNQRASTEPFGAAALSDGTLRFIALATALLQPVSPSTMIIDEPELGLHPQAIAYLGGLIRSAATKTQIIVCTQSPLLVDQFQAEDIVIVSREQGESKFRRLTREELSEWIGDHSLGELWERNVIDGGPRREGV